MKTDKDNEIVISVIIPTYGEPRLLYQAVNSVLNQTFTAYEVIVVDDNDPGTEARDMTGKVLQSFCDNRIKYIRHPRNLNGAAARNTGVACAKGRYIAFLDSDDEYKPERLMKCFNVMEQAEEPVAGIYTGCEFRRNGSVYHRMINVRSENCLVGTLACTFNLGTGSNLFLKKDVIIELSGFDTAFLRHQDYEFLVRVFEKYRFEAIPEILVIKNNANFNLPNVEKIIDIKNLYLRKYRSIIQSCTEEEQRYIYHSHYIQIAEAAQKEKKYQLAREYYRKAGGQQRLSLEEHFRRVAFIGRNLFYRRCCQLADENQ